MCMRGPRAADFELGSRSEVHANGVRSLPPTLRGRVTDHERFIAIVASDRTTLQVVKPLR